jgi:hypothetical protein
MDAPQRDLGTAGIKGVSAGASGSIDEAHGIAVRRAAVVLDVVPEDPGMQAADSGSSAGAQDDRAMCVGHGAGGTRLADRSDVPVVVLDVLVVVLDRNRRVDRGFVPSRDGLELVVLVVVLFLFRLLLFFFFLFFLLFFFLLL